MNTYCFYISIYSGLFTMLDLDLDLDLGVRAGVRVFEIKYPPFWVFLLFFIFFFRSEDRRNVAILYNTYIF